jgi:hypothetical protein
VGCADCGVVATSHGRRRVWVRDLPAGGRPVALLWSKRVWRCQEAVCERGSWTERSDAIAPRASLTASPPPGVPAVGRDGHSVAQVARALGGG